MTRYGAPSSAVSSSRIATAPGVADLVGDVALAQKSLPHFRVAREAGVQHLDRRAAPVAVRCLVDGAHAAHVEQAIDVPLAVERLTDTRLGRDEGTAASIAAH